jgi:hypothetical protein
VGIVGKLADPPSFSLHPVLSPPSVRHHPRGHCHSQRSALPAVVALHHVSCQATAIILVPFPNLSLWS